jgi:hypothetical protein
LNTPQQLQRVLQISPDLKMVRNSYIRENPHTLDINHPPPPPHHSTNSHHRNQTAPKPHHRQKQTTIPGSTNPQQQNPKTDPNEGRVAREIFRPVTTTTTTHQQSRHHHHTPTVTSPPPPKPPKKNHTHRESKLAELNTTHKTTIHKKFKIST